MFDKGSQFRDAFVEICELHEVEWQKSGVQHYISLGMGEMYHAPLRSTYRKLRVEFPHMNKRPNLCMTVRAENYTPGFDGIFPSALLFDEFPTVSTILGTRVSRPTLTERTQDAQRARK